MASSLSLNIQAVVNWITYAALQDTEQVRTALIARMTALAVDEDATPVTVPNAPPYTQDVNVQGILAWIADADAEDAVNLQSMRAAIELRWDAAQYS